MIRRAAGGQLLVTIVALFGLCMLVHEAVAGDWVRFRGPNGSGVSPDDKAPPVHWSGTENLKWKVELPGPGSSSPVVVGNRVFVTCWTGYGLDQENPGDQSDLRRVLVCLDRKIGRTIWSKSVNPVLPEDRYGGMFTEHGYASHTPVSDGQRVYVFFGKTGALAFDAEGNQLWQTNVGKESGINGWGTASSPILYKDLMIVPATAESEALVALDKTTGKEVWRQEANGFSGTWGTPLLVDVDGQRQELVFAVPDEIWGFDPATGKLLWYCQSPASISVCASAIAHDGVVYFVGGRNGGSIAVRAGGKGDVTKTHVVWTGNSRARIGTPIYYEGRIYWFNGRIANCIDAQTGEEIYQARLSDTAAAGSADEDGSQRGAGGRGNGRRRGGGRGQDYSSPVVAGDQIYYVTRGGEAFVLASGPKFRQLAHNRLGGDGEDFSATPAISDGTLFIRSSNHLYCVAEPDN